MSCFIVEPETVNLLAHAIEGTLNQYDQCWRWSVDAEPFKACRSRGVYDAHKIYRLLYIENLKAWNGRYKENVREFGRFKELGFVDFRDTDIMLQLFKRGCCYLYQIAEDGTYNTPLYKAVNDFLSRVAKTIAFHYADEIGVQWG